VSVFLYLALGDTVTPDRFDILPALKREDSSERDAASYRVE